MRLHIQLFWFFFFHFVSLLALAVALWFSSRACVFFRPLSKSLIMSPFRRARLVKKKPFGFSFCFLLSNNTPPVLFFWRSSCT